ncbi:RusA family crossover junction endodeoxyribonuclease [Priestia megaterium]
MDRYHIKIQPMGAVRMTRRGKFVSETAQRYLSYKDEIKRQIVKQVKERELMKDEIEVEVMFFMPIPQSWSKKKREAAVLKPHKSKPDIDNLLKGLFDALNGLIWKDDNLVSKVSAVKIYVPQDEGIMVTVKEIDKEWVYK